MINYVMEIYNKHNDFSFFVFFSSLLFAFDSFLLITKKTNLIHFANNLLSYDEIIYYLFFIVIFSLSINVIGVIRVILVSILGQLNLRISNLKENYFCIEELQLKAFKTENLFLQNFVNDKVLERRKRNKLLNFLNTLILFAIINIVVSEISIFNKLITHPNYFIKITFIVFCVFILIVTIASYVYNLDTVYYPLYKNVLHEEKDGIKRKFTFKNQK